MGHWSLVAGHGYFFSPVNNGHDLSLYKVQNLIKAGYRWYFFTNDNEQMTNDQN